MAVVSALCGATLVTCGNRQVAYGLALRVLVEKLGAMHKVWASQNVLTPDQLKTYSLDLGRFRDIWVAFR